MDYKFYGNDTKSVTPINSLYKNVKEQRHLYDLLNTSWSKDTCPDRLKSKWDKSNNTVGQCSITALIVQDIFGGNIYGIPLIDGGYHCFNKIGDVIFDLTSEQFGDEKLNYSLDNLLNREELLTDPSRKFRYQLLSKELKKLVLPLKRIGNTIILTDEDNKIIASVSYKNIDDNTRDIDRTFVDPILRGQGIANVLVELLYSELENKGYNITASCPFAAKIIAKTQ